MYFTCILARKATNKVRQILPYSQSIRIIIFPRKQNWLGAILGTWKLFWTSWPDNALLFGAVEVQAVVTHNEAEAKWPSFCRQHFEFNFIVFSPTCNPHSPVDSNPEQGSWGQHGANLGPTGPRWAPCWPHEHCYLASYLLIGWRLGARQVTSHYLRPCWLSPTTPYSVTVPQWMTSTLSILKIYLSAIFKEPAL